MYYLINFFKKFLLKLIIFQGEDFMNYIRFIRYIKFFYIESYSRIQSNLYFFKWYYFFFIYLNSSP